MDGFAVGPSDDLDGHPISLGKVLKITDYLRSARSFSAQGMVAAMALAAAMQAEAATYVLPSKGDVVGQLQYIQARAAETLVDVARRYDVGLNAIKAANPAVDPLLPGEGTPIVVPTRHILPKGGRKGVVVNLAEKRLFYYSKPADGPSVVSTYPISIGPEGRSRLGSFNVASRLRKPSWTVPASTRKMMRANGEKVSSVVRPGKNNPLGAYAMKLNAGGYMIHGSQSPFSIGMKVDRGSIRMYPEDIELLVLRAPTGTAVRIVNEPFKYGYRNGALYLELHKPEEEKGVLNHAALVNRMAAIVSQRMDKQDWQRIKQAAERAEAMAMPVAQLRQKPKSKKAWMLQLASYTRFENARKLLLKLEALGMPLSIHGCSNGEKCRVMAGPYTSWKHLEKTKKKVRWITRLKGRSVPYDEPDDLDIEAGQRLASAE